MLQADTTHGVSTNGHNEMPRSSSISKAIFNALAERQRFRRKTDLNRLYMYLKSEGQNLSPEDFLDTFRQLQKQGVGTLIIGRKNNPNRFAWNYNLKDVAKTLIKGEPDFSGLTPLGPKPRKRRVVKAKRLTARRKPGRPVGSKNKPKENDTAPMFNSSSPSTNGQSTPAIQLTIQLSANTKQEDVKALLELAKSLQG